MSNPFDLSGRVAVITGANTGIGQGIAYALAQAGASIVAVGRSPMDETRQLVEKKKGPFVEIKADLGTIAPVSTIIEDTVKSLGGLDILVNNTGIIRRNDAIDFSEEDWDVVMDTNLKSAFFLSQAAARHMIENRSGKIINIASLLSFQGGIRIPSYTASKSGLAGITRLLACEWAGRGINVNAIAPGYFVTNNTTALREDQERSAQILARIPAGRWGEPSDIGGAAVFLASHASDYVHGAMLTVFQPFRLARPISSYRRWASPRSARKRSIIRYLTRRSALS
jgi:2-dehydro-3-deoxy-D-gluconate 5-dehydrogenase